MILKLMKEVGAAKFFQTFLHATEIDGGRLFGKSKDGRFSRTRYRVRD
jgi:hypothetical protein